MTDINTGRFRKGDPRTVEAARKGGLNSGKDNPNNFKNNPELARKAGKVGGRISRRKKVSNGTK